MGGDAFRLAPEEIDDFFQKDEGDIEVFQADLQDGESRYFLFWRGDRVLYGDLDRVKQIDGGAVIYSLEEESFGKSLTIYYWPQKYVWDRLWSDLTGEFGEEVDRYIESIKEEITQDCYLENGSMTDLGIYMGDEAAAPEFPLAAEYPKSYYKADIANTGETVYMRKTNVVTWLASGSAWYLQMNFYLFHEEKQEIIELEDMEVNHGGHAKIVQLWFQEIGGKTIMFRVYNLSAFNYLLNTAVIENGEIRSLRNDIFSPEMAFEILLDEAEPI